MAKSSRSKNIFRFLLFAGTAISLYFVPWLLVKAWIFPLPDTVQEQIDDALEYGFEGIIVYVDQAGKEPRSFAAGYHNRDSQLPARTDALYKIASIGKLYEAVTVTKLVGDGRLSLDKTLAEYLPDLADRIEYSDQITLRSMVQHRSGIPNYSDTPRYWENPDISYEERLALFLDKPANFPPDTEYEYCNTNYMLLNTITHNELGYDTFLFVEEEVLKPLNLQATYSSVNDVDEDSMMSGYHKGYPHDLKEDDLGMVATAEDVGVFLRALNEGTFFENDEHEIYASIYEFNHSGWVPGYQSFAEYHEDIDAVIVTFYNTTDADLFNWNLSEIFNGRIKKIVARDERTENGEFRVLNWSK